MTTTLEKALQIAGSDPLPVDARDQLKELRPQLHEFEFERVMEALAVNEFEQGGWDNEDEIIGGPDDNQLTS